MIRARLFAAAFAVASVASLGAARAQTAPTCNFNAGTGNLNVGVNGIAATLVATGAGVIKLNGVACGSATTSTVDTINVTGGGLADTFTITGSYFPGLTQEDNGVDEIELNINLGGSTADVVTVNMGNGHDILLFQSATAADFN